MNTTHAEALQDAELAHTDADIVVAGITELEQLLSADRLDGATAREVSRDVLPRLTALHAYLLDLCAEVAA